jgi:hypothetical protein
MQRWTAPCRMFAALAVIVVTGNPTSHAQAQAQEVTRPCVEPAQLARSVASITWYFDQTRTERDGKETIGERATGWFFHSPRWLVTAAHFARDLPAEQWQEVELGQAAPDGSQDRTVRAKVRLLRHFEPGDRKRVRRTQTGAGDMAVLEVLNDVPGVQPLEIRAEPPSPDENVLVLAYPAGDLRVARGVVREAEAPAGKYEGLSLFEVEGANRLLLNGGASGAPVVDCHHGRVTAVVAGLLTGASLPFLPPGTVIPTPWGSPTNAAVPARVLAALQDASTPSPADEPAGGGSLAPPHQGGAPD